MAELHFDYMYTDTDAGRTQMAITNEPDNKITKFYLDAEEFQQNQKDQLELADYDNILWTPFDKLITPLKVSDLRLKSFPQIGTIALFTSKYEARSLLMVPVYRHNTLGRAPILAMQSSSLTRKLTFTITLPADTDYDCYRIILLRDEIAEEYITYDRALTIDYPVINGTYTIWAQGYNKEMLASEDSNYLSFVVTGGRDRYPSASGLPEVTAADNDKILIVAGGEWTLEKLQAALGGRVFVFDPDSGELDITAR